MEIINIADQIGTTNAIIQKFGLSVYAITKKAIEDGNTVVLDFSKLTNATTGFFHALIGNLYRDYGDRYDAVVQIVGIEGRDEWKEKYDDAISLVSDRHRKTDLDRAIASLFAE